MEKFAVIITKTVHHEGDERSRQYPGHGYPAHTTEHQEFKEFVDEKEFKQWVERQEDPKRTYSREKYKAIRFSPVNIKTKTIFDYEFNV